MSKSNLKNSPHRFSGYDTTSPGYTQNMKYHGKDEKLGEEVQANLRKLSIALGTTMKQASAFAYESALQDPKVVQHYYIEAEKEKLNIEEASMMEEWARRRKELDKKASALSLVHKIK
jgi:hypothetical protein